jgi:hypothetical protein
LFFSFLLLVVAGLMTQSQGDEPALKKRNAVAAASSSGAAKGNAKIKVEAKAPANAAAAAAPPQRRARVLGVTPPASL